MNIIKDKKVQQNGMALGGIGTGTVEINQNGILKDWHIFNLGKWASVDVKKNKRENLYDYEKNVMPFYIRTKQGEDLPKIRKLSHDIDNGEFRSMMFSWHKEVKEISYDASFPICELSYIDDSLPVKIHSEFTSPFVPLDSRLSGTPGFFATFYIENISDDDVEVSLLGKLKNPINRGIKDRHLRNILNKNNDQISITMKSDETNLNQQNESISFSVSGGEPSFIQGDFSAFFSNYVLNGEYGVTEESYLFNFRKTGTLPNLGSETIPDYIINLTDKQLDLFNDLQVEDVLAQIIKIPSVNSPYKRILEVDKAILANRKGKLEFIRFIKNKMQEIMTDSEGEEAWGDSALSSTITLRPGEKKEIQFIVSWFFPNHYSDLNRFIGHMYTNWFQDSKEVNEFMFKNSSNILDKVRKFSKELSNTDINASMIHNWINQLNTIIKCSWWSQKGDFAIWEGYGSCGFHTMDITYQGSFNLLALFPDLQLIQMELGAKFQREDGRVHHLLTPDFYSVDDSFSRVDMNPQFVLLVCRDYLWTGDLEYVKRLWNSVVKAMESIEKLDGNDDCLPDQETKNNTYDAWNFKGTPSYISSLWLAALLAASRMAEDLGKHELKSKWQKMLQQGKENFKQMLWNGEYFSLWVDDETRDECCMADQIDGQWYAQLLGLGVFIPKQLIEGALKAIIKYDYHTETGLINAAYPPNTKPILYTYCNIQAEMNWSGIEFAFVSALLENGMVEKAMELSENVENRYLQAGRIFNHEECGDHYYRAMSSWALLLSVTGFKLDVPKGMVTFIPPVQSIKAPWFSPSGFGHFEKQPKAFELICQYGELSFSKLILNIQTDIKQVYINGESISFEVMQEDNHKSIKFDKNIELKPDMVLSVVSL